MESGFKEGFLLIGFLSEEIESIIAKLRAEKWQKGVY